MAYKSCQNCGERQYNGYYTNCHEEHYIEQQKIKLEAEIKGLCHRGFKAHAKNYLCEDMEID